MTTVLLTGATGFLGRNLLRRILTGDSSTRVVALVRGGSDREAKRRVEGLLSHDTAGPSSELLRRVEVIRGDISAPGLGFCVSARDRLAQTVTHVIHAAASVKFPQSLDLARAANVDGTRNVLEFATTAARSGALSRIAHISTAYVCGDRRGRILERELDLGQGFSNSYEQTKFEAEQLARMAAATLPVTVFRPSIVVGDSRTGVTSAFNVLYAPLRLIQNGSMDSLPGHPEAELDVVPVDYVCNAIYQIVFHGDSRRGETFHLTAGRAGSLTAGEIVDLAVEFFSRTSARELPPVRFLPGGLYRAAGRALYGTPQRSHEAMAAFEPYLAGNRSFDDSHTASALGRKGIRPPALRFYLDVLLRYCVDTAWGTRRSIRSA